MLGQLGGLASLAGLNIGSSASNLEESLAVLRSREFTEAFIRDEGIITELFYKRWDEDAGLWLGSEEDQPTPAQAFKFFDRRVRTASRDLRTGLITVQIVWRDPVKAATWANELVGRLNAEMRSRAIARTNASLEYLEKELAATATVETRQAIARLIEAQVNQRMLASVTEEYAFHIVDRALPPDLRDEVGPRKALLMAFGLILGLFFGACAVLVAGARAPRP
jgi:hypothetical protein